MGKNRKQTTKALLQHCLILGGIAAFLRCIFPPFKDRFLEEKIYKEKIYKVGDSFRTHEQEHISDSQLERQVAFYDNHITQIRKYTRRTSVLEWRTRGEDSIQPLLRNFPVRDFNDNDNYVSSLPSSGGYVGFKGGGICPVSKAFHNYWNISKSPEPKPHILFAKLNENWGAFSSVIINKTAPWGDLETRWEIEGCSNESIWEYLDHPDTVMVVTMQFQKFYHPKVHSIPIGVLSSWTDILLGEIKQMIDDNMKNKTRTREQLLMVNSNTSPNRLLSTNAVNQTFGGTLVNSYGMDMNGYYREMQKFKFILSPSGMGVDCYRHWEAIYMGTIPVIETLNRTDRWFRTLDNLPVVFIDSYENLTPEFLEQEYSKIIARPLKQYHYEKMTKQYWIRLIKKTFRRYNHNHNKAIYNHNGNKTIA